MIGYSDSEALIMEYLLDRGEAAADEIINETKLSRGTVYKVLSSLVDWGKINKTNNRPVIYYLTGVVKEDITNEFNDFYKTVIEKLTIKRDISKDKLYSDIYRVFENNGFVLRNVSLNKSLFERITRYFPMPDRIAEAEYSIAIYIIGKDKNIDVGVPPFVYLDNIKYTLRMLNCITPFIFINSDRKDSKIIYNSLSEISSGKERIPIRQIGVYNDGIEGNEIFLFDINDDIEKKITNSIREIRQRHMLVRDLIIKLREKIELNQELVLLSQEHIRYVEDFLLKMEPFSQNENVQLGIKEISEPIQRMTNRENRNLSIFRRKFSENEVRINQYIDRIESRRYLPMIETIEKDISELSQIELKFKPIEYELNYIRQGIFKYALELSQIKEKKLLPGINPFLFTVPYEKIPFYANQKILEKAAKEIAISINENLPNFFQILCGDAGVGKTHALKYIYEKIMAEKGIKSLYVECPVNYDLLSGIFQELTQDSIYPNEVVQSVRNLRRITPTATRDYIRVFSEISDIWKKIGYSGILVVLDELENSLPYIFRTNSRIEASIEDIYRLPIALRQIREIFKYDRFVDNMGFVVACRSRILNMLKNALDIENLNDFVYQPEKLNTKEFLEVIEHRYKSWNIDSPIFDEVSITEISRKTNSNTRNVIKYCRALYEFAKRNNISIIDKKIVENIGPIPLFTF